MSETAETKRVTDVASMLLPVTGRTLLLPSVAVAEIINFIRPDRTGSEPAWLLGSITWRKQEVPLMTYEVANDQPQPKFTSASRIAVLNSTGFSDDIPFLAIVTQGLPRLARVKEDEMIELLNAVVGPADLAGVRAQNVEVYIPDVTKLEGLYQDYLKSRQ